MVLPLHKRKLLLNLLNINSQLLDIYSTWYNISQNSISSNHPLTRYKPLGHFDKSRIRLFYCRHGLGKINVKFMITPRTEIVLYIILYYIILYIYIFFCLFFFWFFLQRLESLKKYFHKKKNCRI